ncbi:MAG: DUF4153 domain-containing protein [Lachnospiraceae bacterium]|nr:DUF4153 domain-containing protein [Lachnospiraceae bacterium]
MGKIKELLAEQKNVVKEIFFRYIATIIAVFLFCLVAIYEVDNTGSGEVAEHLMTFFAIFACGSFFIETVFKKNKVITYVIDALISLLFTALAFNLYDWAGQDVFDTFVKYFILYIIILLGMSFYTIIKKSGMSFQGYVNTVGLNLGKWCAIFAILNLGILIIFEIYNSLIVKIDVYDFWAKFELLLTGILYFPYALICITPDKEEKPKFFKVLLKFLLVPLLLIAMIIIYMYIFKILFIGSVPSNEVFEICAGVFVLGFVISTLAYAYLDNATVKAKNGIAGAEESNEAGKKGIYEKIILYLKYGFIPMVLLEIYSLGIRISDYGVTEDRYIGVVFIIAQIIYIAWEPINKLISGIGRVDIKEADTKAISSDTFDNNEISTEKKKDEKTGFGKGYEKLIFVAIIIYIFTVIVPFTNIEFCCYASQKSRMEKALLNNDYATAHSALNSIRYNRYGKKYLDENYTEEELEEIHSKYYEIHKNNGEYYYSGGVYISPYYNSPEIDIAGYSKMYTFSNTISYSFEMDDADLILKSQSSDTDNADRLEINDVSDIVSDALKDYGYNSQDSSRNYEAVPIREYVFGDKKLIINNLSFYYFEDGKTISGFHIAGYVLIK